VSRVVAALLGALLMVLPLGATPSTAEAEQTRAPLHVTHIQPVDSGPLAGTGRIIVTLSNQRVDVLTPCRVEDGRHCYWDASSRGNHIGYDWIVTRGHKFRVEL
jgi:hypothetical protein